jgi:hypothetical protein
MMFCADDGRRRGEGAGRELTPPFLAAYCPEQSGIEPVWNDVKQHHMSVRSFERVVELKQATDHALTRKAEQVRHKAEQSMNIHRLFT